jgi:transcriptional regulator with PAS, ATPase and Fis domain
MVSREGSATIEPEMLEHGVKFGADNYIGTIAHRERFGNVAIDPRRSERRTGLTSLPSIEELRREKLITESRKMRQILKFIERVAQLSDLTVLIEGETGTGKELISELIHYGSPRAHGPFVTINSGAIPINLIESELFGYDRGSFTGALSQGKKGKFEIANGGTILLDEIVELPLEAQTKLLRVLEEKAFYRVGGTQKIRIDVRVIAASNKSLEHAVRAGQFREDLYYRLNVAKVAIPPLRERREDIIAIAMFYIEKANSRFGRNFQHISEEARGILLSHPWRGNVRELRNVIERVLIAENSDVLEARHLRFLEDQKPVSLQTEAEAFPGRLPDGGIELEEVVKNLIVQAMERTRGNMAKAARLLGISKPTLVYRLQKFGLK